ncbi:hypothetical protein KFE25_004387 [Diacronema lutheri]|uniref:Uncharacterized protein n=1 Tax=Diacronema lutheri TaxID=2081491 RepID=A0A8J5X6J9_DIALT|nr:hypothetical protein KFE25_004387 [Diacronema lutheri]
MEDRWCNVSKTMFICPARLLDGLAAFLALPPTATLSIEAISAASLLVRIFIVQRAQGSTPLVDVAAGLAALSLDELSAELGTIVIAPARAIRVGCVDPAAANYDSLATDSELRACQYVLGDEDSTQSADVDDGDAPVVVQTRASTASPSDGGPLAPGAALAELFANDPGAMAALVLAILVATLCGCALCARCAHRRAIASVSQRTKDAILKAESEAAAATAAALAAAAEAAAATAAAGASAAACDEAVSGEARARNELATLAQAQQQAALCATVDCGRHEGAARPVPDRPVPDPGAARRRVKLPALSAYGGTLPACVIYSSPAAQPHRLAAASAHTHSAAPSAAPGSAGGSGSRGGSETPASALARFAARRRAERDGWPCAAAPCAHAATAGGAGAARARGGNGGDGDGRGDGACGGWALPAGRRRGQPRGCGGWWRLRLPHGRRRRQHDRAARQPVHIASAQGRRTSESNYDAAAPRPYLLFEMGTCGDPGVIGQRFEWASVGV